MKALRKKYGKKRWEDTPNAAWYWRRKAGAQFMAQCLASGMSMQAYNQVQQIRASSLPQHEKACEIAKAIISGQQALIQSRRLAMGLEPDPNRP